MKPAAFGYLRADDADTAIAALARHGEEARILAGGQSLMAVLNMRLAQPALLIDISRSPALAQLRMHDGRLCIGAAATQASVEWRAGLAREVPLLALAFPHISHFQVRNRGTVAGSIAHADPSAELPLCLLALDGEVVLRHARRQRVLKAAEFFTGMLLTARANDELLEEVRFPLAQAGSGHGFEEFAVRHGDFAICAVAAVADAQRLRIAVGGVADRPVARDFPPALDGSALDDALNEFAWSLEARDEPQASARLRRQLVRTLGRRAVEQALAARSSAARSVDSLARKAGEGRGEGGTRRTRPAPHPSPYMSAPTSLRSCPPRGRQLSWGGPATVALPVPGRGSSSVRLTLNGQARSGTAEPRLLLSDFLRHELGATGTHVGCEHGVCGACTVRIDGVAARACLTLAVQVDGGSVDTVEGLAGDDGALGDLQAAFKRHHALQCGFCTAGILMSCADWLERVSDPSEAEVREMLSGHLCRCTGYTPIVAAVLDVARARAAAANSTAQEPAHA